MGFSDVGCFGGEIHTPNLDALAKGGVKMAQFYNNARCCPTRASLLTGLRPHQAGVGKMTEEEARDDTGTPPAYIGEFSKNTVTIAGAEMNNLASQDPARVKKMADEWKAWADRVHVYPKAMEKPEKRDQKGKGGDSAKAED